MIDIVIKIYMSTNAIYMYQVREKWGKYIDETYNDYTKERLITLNQIR